MAASTDWLVGRGDAGLHALKTLLAQNRLTEADRTFADAVNLYERKEATVMADAANALLANRYRTSV